MSQRKNTDREARAACRDELRATCELIHLFHESGIHLPTRAVYLGAAHSDVEGSDSGTDAKMAEALIKNLHVLERLGDGPISIIMNNQGGDVYHGLAIYDAIKQSPCEVVVIVRGYAMSMGSVILQAADRRVMGPTATQMIHYGSLSTSGHARTVARQVAEDERISDWMEQMYLERMQAADRRTTIADVRRMLDHDTYIPAHESVRLGLADEVG